MGQALAGAHVKLERMAGPDDDLALAPPGRLPAGGRVGYRRAAGGAAAQRAILMKAGVRQGVVPAAHVEHADFTAAHCHHNMLPLRHIGHLGHHVWLAHRAGTFRLTLWPSKRRAFSLMILRRTSGESGICNTLVG